MTRAAAIPRKRILTLFQSLLLSLVFTQTAAFGQMEWKSATKNSPFAGRGYHSAVSYDTKLWILHGMNGSDRWPDIWYTSDGANWTKATGSVPYPMRCGMGVLAFNEYMWIAAGGDNC